MSENVKEFLIKSSLCTFIYEQSERNTDYGVESQTILKRCIPNDGVFLYEIEATYAKQIPPSKYYYFGKSVKEAKERFNKIMTWMKITSIRLILSKEEMERILINPKRLPI